MLCNVDLNFKFIGGSSLGGPVSQLQNAVGFNFFANTGLYNPRTIYSSIQQYEKNKPDAKSGLGTEIEDDKINNTSTSKSYGFGAYIKPNQILNSKGEFEDEPQPPIPPQPEENIKKQQKDDEGIVEQKTDEFSQSELDQIKEEFEKKADKRAGAFKAYLKRTKLDFTSEKINMKTFNLCSKEYYTNQLIYIKSNQESITKIQIEYPDGGVSTYDFNETTTKTSGKNGVVSNAEPKRKSIVIWDSADKENSIIVKETGGIQAGRYSIIAYSLVESTLEEEGTTELSEEIASPEVEMYVECCDNGNVSGFTYKLNDIPETGNC